MRSYLANLPASVWALAVIPAVLVAYPIARAVVPVVFHAMVPEVVRSMLHMM